MGFFLPGSLIAPIRPHEGFAQDDRFIKHLAHREAGIVRENGLEGLVFDKVSMMWLEGYAAS
jgi:hypothetical protein